MDRPHRSLCPRCGAVYDAPRPEAGQRLQGRCPSCGLGSTTTALTFTSSAGPPDPSVEAEHQRLTAQRQVQTRRAVARCTFPVYGLDGTWSGRRFLGGWGESDGEVDFVELGHGDPYRDESPVTRVCTEPATGGPGTRDLGVTPEQERAFVLWRGAKSLARRAWHAGVEHSAAMQETFSADDPTASWSALELTVDGSPVTFRSLAGTTSWVALGDHEGSVIAVEARNIDPAAVRLVVVDDLEPYLADDGMPR